MKGVKQKEAYPEDDQSGSDRKSPAEIREEKTRLYKEIIKVSCFWAVFLWQ